MSGTASAILTGWAIPMVSLPWDHSYVTSSCGLQWHCRGRVAGGIAIAMGQGSSIIADCLSQINSHAGLRYWKDGVCHQMANRMLYPAGQVTVAKCNGYGFSSFRYGHYGKGTWHQLATCYPPGTIHAGGIGTPSQQDDAMANTNAYGRSDYLGQADQQRRLSELEQTILVTLGRPLDPETFTNLAAIQAQLWREDNHLDWLLEHREIDEDQYFHRMNAAAATAMTLSRAVLGAEAFRAIFGELGEHPEQFIDRETLLASNGEG